MYTKTFSFSNPALPGKGYSYTCTIEPFRKENRIDGVITQSATDAPRGSLICSRWTLHPILDRRAGCSSPKRGCLHLEPIVVAPLLYWVSHQSRLQLQ